MLLFTRIFATLLSCFLSWRRNLKLTLHYVTGHQTQTRCQRGPWRLCHANRKPADCEGELCVDCIIFIVSTVSSDTSSWLHLSIFYLCTCRLLVAVVTTSMKPSPPMARPSWWACPPSSARTSGSREVSSEVGWLRYNRDHSVSINQLGNVNTAASLNPALFICQQPPPPLLFDGVLLPCWSVITTCISCISWPIN